MNAGMKLEVLAESAATIKLSLQNAFASAILIFIGANTC